MHLVVIYPKSSGDGINILQPMADARRTVVVTPAVFAEVEIAPDVMGQPYMVTPAETRPETDLELATWVAKKDVPAGRPYRIVPRTDLPEDRADRDLWTADFATPDGHGGDQ